MRSDRRAITAAQSPRWCNVCLCWLKCVCVCVCLRSACDVEHLPPSAQSCCCGVATELEPSGWYHQMLTRQTGQGACGCCWKRLHPKVFVCVFCVLMPFSFTLSTGRSIKQTFLCSTRLRLDSYRWSSATVDVWCLWWSRSPTYLHVLYLCPTLLSVPTWRVFIGRCEIVTSLHMGNAVVVNPGKKKRSCQTVNNLSCSRRNGQWNSHNFILKRGD